VAEWDKRVLSACLIAPLVTVPWVGVAALVFPELPQSVEYVLPYGARVREGGWSVQVAVAFGFSITLLVPAYATTVLVGLPFHRKQQRIGERGWVPYLRLGATLGGSPPLFYKMLFSLLEPTTTGVPLGLIFKLAVMGGTCGALVATTFWLIATGHGARAGATSS
jgi:hypothetical protein